MDEIERILSDLAGYEDDEINDVVSSLFSKDEYVSELDAAGLYIVLMDMKEQLEGRNETTWFDMETLVREE